MNYRTAVTIFHKLYKFLAKTGFDAVVDLDGYICNNYPEFLARLQTYSNKEKISLLATNGKKTTLDLINRILLQDNRNFITNVDKNALKKPMLTSIIENVFKDFDCFGYDNKKDHYTIAQNIFEIIPNFNFARFDVLLLHNLFMDQKNLLTLTRKKKVIQEALILNPKLNLIINADEPMFYNIDEIKKDNLPNKSKEKLYYGFNSLTFFENDEKLIQKNDYLNCPVCGCKLEYKKRFFSHLGHFDCGCGFSRPKLDISCNAKVFKDYCFLDVFYKEEKMSFKVPLGGSYNAYNVLAAIALALYLKIPRKTITQALENYSPISFRDEIIRYKDKNIKLKIAKNPVSLAESLKELWGEKDSKCIFCLTDKKIDGFDTSWIWSANFEALSGFENRIYTTGNRADDIALRLKYAKVAPGLIIVDPNIKSTIECCYYDLAEKENMLIITTLAGVEEIQKVIKA